jgi:uncharacterized membrane protein YfcA
MSDKAKDWLATAVVIGTKIGAWTWLALTKEWWPVALWFGAAIMVAAAAGDVGEDC